MAVRLLGVCGHQGQLSNLADLQVWGQRGCEAGVAVRCSLPTWPTRNCGAGAKQGVGQVQLSIAALQPACLTCKCGAMGQGGHGADAAVRCSPPTCLASKCGRQEWRCRGEGGMTGKEGRIYVWFFCCSRKHSQPLGDISSHINCLCLLNVLQLLSQQGCRVGHCELVTVDCEGVDGPQRELGFVRSVGRKCVTLCAPGKGWQGEVGGRRCMGGRDLQGRAGVGAR